MKQKLKTNKGITLIALILTIIVLLILAILAINAVKGDGIIAHTKNAKAQYTGAQTNELTMLQNYENQLNKEQLNIEITVEGKKVKLTENNVKDYLGKVVTNYTGATSVTIAGETYTVSPTYRLYYVDFDNKYGDGAGTIYLKADYTTNLGNYQLPTTDTTSATEPNIKIKNLNPELYKSGVTAPTATNSNMKAVTWLTNVNNWLNLKDTSMESNINYVVGAPSLEMMMDSHNTHYGLTGDTPDYSDRIEGENRKLFYKYTSGAFGYQVGPYNGAEYGDFTLLFTDPTFGTMYTGGYWIASPSVQGSENIMYMYNRESGYSVCVGACYFDGNASFCPLVSLKSSANLILAE